MICLDVVEQLLRRLEDSSPMIRVWANVLTQFRARFLGSQRLGVPSSVMKIASMHSVAIRLRGNSPR